MQLFNERMNNGGEIPDSASEVGIGGAPRRDPAEQRGYLHLFYRGWRPTRLGRIWSRAYAWLCGFGLLPPGLLTLQVRSWRTGRLSSTVLVVATHQGQRDLVSMLGDGSEWVRNLRAAGGRALIKRGQTSPVVLTEIPPRQRAPILKAWSQIASSGRQHVPVAPDAPVAEFEAIANDYPVFRIDPELEQRGCPVSRSPINKS